MPAWPPFRTGILSLYWEARLTIAVTKYTRYRYNLSLFQSIICISNLGTLLSCLYVFQFDPSTRNGSWTELDTNLRRSNRNFVAMYVDSSMFQTTCARRKRDTPNEEQGKDNDSIKCLCNIQSKTLFFLQEKHHPINWTPS